MLSAERAALEASLEASRRLLSDAERNARMVEGQVALLERRRVLEKTNTEQVWEDCAVRRGDGSLGGGACRRGVGVGQIVKAGKVEDAAVNKCGPGIGSCLFVCGPHNSSCVFSQRVGSL